MNFYELVISLSKWKLRQGIILCKSKDTHGRNWEYLHCIPQQGKTKWKKNLPGNTNRDFILCLEGPVIHKKKSEYKSVLRDNPNIKSLESTDLIFFTSKTKLKTILADCDKNNVSVVGEFWWDALKVAGVFEKKEELAFWANSYLKKSVPQNLKFSYDHSEAELKRTTFKILIWLYPILIMFLVLGFFINHTINNKIETVENNLLDQRKLRTLSEAKQIEIQSKNRILIDLGFGRRQEFSKIIDNISQLKPADIEFSKLRISHLGGKKYEITLSGKSMNQERTIEFLDILNKQIKSDAAELDRLLRLRGGFYQFELKFVIDEKIQA